MRGLLLHRRELPGGPRREAGLGKLRPEAGLWIQGHAAGRAFPGSRGRPGASCSPRGVGASDLSEAVRTAASEPRPCRRPSDLPADKDCFVLRCWGH